LSGAGAAVQDFENRTVWLVLGLDGHRYYVFASQGNSPLTPDWHARQRLAINDQIRSYAALTGAGHTISPSKVRRLEAQGPLSFGTAPQPGAFDRLEGIIQDEMYGRGIRPSAHAGEFLIHGWKTCVGDYMSVRHKAPSKAEIFLSQSPCRTGDPAPSQARTIDSTPYPESCRNKLYVFFAKNKTVTWTVLYDQRFRTAGPVGDDGMPGLFAGWSIRRMHKQERQVFGLQ